MKYCDTQATLTRTWASSLAQRRTKTRRPRDRKTLVPLCARRTEGFSSLKNRRNVKDKTTPMTLASRRFLCNRDTVGTRSQAAAGNKTLESDFYYASLILLPDELCAAIDDGSSSGRSRHFVLFEDAKLRSADVFKRSCSGISFEQDNPVDCEVNADSV